MPSNSKITPQATQRIAAHTLADQLAKAREIHAAELQAKDQDHDQDEVRAAFEADKAWDGQYNRLSKGWDASGPD